MMEIEARAGLWIQITLRIVCHVYELAGCSSRCTWLHCTRDQTGPMQQNGDTCIMCQDSIRPLFPGKKSGIIRKDAFADWLKIRRTPLGLPQHSHSRDVQLGYQGPGRVGVQCLTIEMWLCITGDLLENAPRSKKSSHLITWIAIPVLSGGMFWVGSVRAVAPGLEILVGSDTSGPRPTGTGGVYV
jgi:hypothetical protein